MRTALLAAAACVIAIGIVAGQAGAPAARNVRGGVEESKPTSAAVPDWRGVWQMVGPTVFDRTTVQPQNGRAGDPGVREFPPYTDAYEAIYRKNIERIKAGTFPDPISVCGVPHGFPRIMNVPDVYEFAVTPAATYVLAENGPGILRIYTDGRKHPPAEELWGTYTGASVGHWEGDTLVFETRGLKESRDNDVIVDRTGLVLSDAAKVATRMRKANDMMMEAVITVEDSKALKAPWKVTKQYRKLPEGTWAWDYGCAENNRNPISNSGKTLTLGPDGKPIDKNTE